MFLHQHPYKPFLPSGADRLIVGTLPPPRFSTGALHDDDVNFCYGSRDGLLWPALERIFKISLRYENTPEAIAERKEILSKTHIGIFDIVASAQREKVDASDLGMQQIRLRDLTAGLGELTAVKALLFTGGNSRNGPEYFFRKHLREKGLRLEQVSSHVPRIHRFYLDSRPVYTVSLTAPSGAANRAIGGMDAYKAIKQHSPGFTTFDFRVQQYKPFFTLPFWESL